MSDNKNTILQPQYVSNFNCIGSECEDTCCCGWQVYIDKSTYKKYREYPDKKLRSQLDKIVTRTRNNIASDNGYAKINPKADGNCPLLDEDKLCSIQRNLGEENLSSTCRTYPRISNNVDGKIEKSLTMSCPEAIRKALFHPNIMEFDEIKEDASTHNLIHSVMNTVEDKLAKHPERSFWQLRIFTITVLQNRNYSLWQRLIILGMFYKKINQFVIDDQLNEITKSINQYMDMIEQGLFKEQLDAIPTNHVIQMKLIKHLVTPKTSKGIKSQRFLDCYNEFLQGIGCASEADVEDSFVLYNQSYNQFYQPYMGKNEHIMENYLVNHVFKNLFPFAGEKQIFDNYVMMIVHYAMIKMLLIGMAGFHKEKFGDEQVVKLIQSFGKVIEHDEVYLKKILMFFHDNKLTSMPYMSVLIKN